MRWVLFLAVYIVQLSVSAPEFFATCTLLDTTTIAMYLTHHLSDVFLFWGPLFIRSRAEAALHLALIVITTTHWLSNQNRCVATVELNKRCGYDPELWLDSLLNRSGLRGLSEYYQFAWLAPAAIYDLWLCLN